MGKVELHLGKVPPNIVGQLQFCLDLYRKLTAKGPKCAIWGAVAHAGRPTCPAR